MKKILSTTIFLLLFLPFAYAQDYSTLFSDLGNEVPLDPKIKKGKLKNGITYYIRQNNKPENRITLRLVVNAGTLLEKENQDGLAHFAEHMAFNGTENFEKNEIVKYLQSIGVKFGADLNAYTAFDETVYFLPIPTDNDTIVENGFQIIEDWAHNVTFEPEEIDKERGIILEELRLRNNANRRMANEYIPVLLNNDVYENILNSEMETESIKTFEHEALINYYNDWYRPDLMAVIAVGDMDPEIIEQKIKEHFGRIKPAKKPKTRTVFEIPDHQETLVEIATDKEATNTAVQIYYKNDVKEIITLNDYKNSLVRSLYTGMLNLRLRELTQNPNPPFIVGGVSYGGTYNRNKDAFSAYASVSETGIEEGLKALLIENQRVKQHGFTEGELERYKKEMVKSYERAYNERDKTESSNYADEYQRNYLVDEVIPGIEFEYSFVKEIIDDITLKEVNNLNVEFIKDYNRVIIVTAPEKEGLKLPSEQDLLDILKEAEESTVEPYEDKLAGASLLAEIPAPGEIVSETKDEETGVTHLELSNGIKIALKPTDFKNDEIQFTAFSDGGTSIYPDEYYESATFADAIIQGCGYGDYSPSDLQKILAGKVVSVSPYIGDLEEGLNGSCAPKDVETMFQLIHLAFTDPNQNEDLFDAYLSRLKSYFKNVLENPINYFYNQRIDFMTQNHPRGGGYPTEEDFEKVEFEKAFEVYKERFADASDFNFIFVGNFDVEEIKPMLETYLGSLANLNRQESWKDQGIRPPSGVARKEIFKGNDPKSLVYMYFHDKYNFDRKTNYHISSVAEALEIKLIEILREEQSGVYSTGVYSQTEKYPYENYNLIVAFPCAPENVDTLISATHREIKKIQENGVLEEDMVKVKETQKREMEVNLKENGFWKNVIKNSMVYGWDLKDVLEYEERIEALTSQELKDAAQKYFDFDSRATVILFPEGSRPDEEQ